MREYINMGPQLEVMFTTFWEFFLVHGSIDLVAYRNADVCICTFSCIK